jgi:pimeloyl-ACP methyl ester carboxylesterase
MENLSKSGRSVRAPLLLSIGEDWSDFTEEIWQSWLLEAESALISLTSQCENVFLAGLASAGALALRLAEKQGESIDGIILLDPTLPEPNRRLKKVRKDLENELYFVDQPIILIYSAQSEGDINPHSELISSAVSSPLIREIALENPFDELSLVAGEIDTFIAEVVHGFWNRDVAGDDTDLIDAEFEAIVAGLSLDESSPSNYLDDLDRPEPEEHFNPPDPHIAPITNRGRRSAIFAMIAGPVYAITAAIAGFDPFGIEPWPGVTAAIGGLGYFFYSLQDDEPEDDGAIL